MIAVFVNMLAVLIGSSLGLLFHKKINPERTNTVISALGLVTVVIGIMGAIKTQNIVCLIVCTALGAILGTTLKIEAQINRFGDRVNSKFFHNHERYGKFTDGFVGACIIFCVGAMTVVGSLKAGVDRDYSIIFAKSALDLVSSTILAAGMGIGVLFSVVFILAFQGGLTLLAGYVAPYLSEAVVTELSAVGGTILIGLGLNILNIGENKIKVADMTPAIFLPIAYIPLSDAVRVLFST
ncbi:MAG: DUF554 domain-containing protein [Thermoguttaceae bacterium]|nr:DUF554 domain-containing protein [Thermoguttaceae bacterium]MBQ4204835.1 DUF554 domain-containing protein [Thermoguttaceae bacterium]